MNRSHDPIWVAFVWMTSVVRPPPPTAARKSPLLDWIAQVSDPLAG